MNKKNRARLVLLLQYFPDFRLDLQDLNATGGFIWIDQVFFCGTHPKCSLYSFSTQIRTLAAVVTSILLLYCTAESVKHALLFFQPTAIDSTRTDEAESQRSL